MNKHEILTAMKNYLNNGGSPTTAWYKHYNELYHQAVRDENTDFIMNYKFANVTATHKFTALKTKDHPAVPEDYIYIVDSNDVLVNKVNLHPVAEAPRTKNRAYTIIDHFGSLDSDNCTFAAYSRAYKLSAHDKANTFTIKKFCEMLSKNPNTKVSDKQKNFVRANFNPSQVIIIVNQITPQVQWRIDNWAEKADEIIVLEVYEDTKGKLHIEQHTFADIHPEWAVTTTSTDSKFRRCANIWGNALGWTFSAPLYRDNSREMDEMYLKRNDRSKFDDTAHLTKIASRPASYINSKIAVAPESECQEFFNYYAYLYKTAADPDNDLTMKDFLEPGYEICPDCGKPIRVGASNKKQCSYCTFEAEDIEIARYFEADDYDEE